MASYPALEDWFSTSIRRNRKSFMLAAAALFIVMLVVFLIVSWFKPSDRTALFVFAPFVGAYLICSYTLTGQRLRDMGLTGWLALLWLPVNIADAYLNGAALIAAWIVLCSVPGTKGPNRYGPDPVGAEADAQRSA